MSLFARLLVVAAMLPLAFATSRRSSDSSCKSSEFYWNDKDCCLPYGGAQNPPSPPKGSSCPSSWEWHSEKSCCVPQQPPPTTTPSCNNGWGWNASKKCCEQPTPSTSHHSTPTPEPTTSRHSTPTQPSHTTPTQPSHTTPTQPSKPTSSSSCDSSEWFWEPKSCCLPHGGNPNPPTPPGGSSCPPSWDWHSGKKCCVPHHPNQPPPQCGSGWGWEDGSKCCYPHTSTSPTPTPSSKPGKPGHGYGWKRNHKARSVSLCPNDMTACPISGLKGLSDDWECLDTTSELQSCGGCASTGAGQDCTAIKGAWNVGCNAGKCVVYTCAQGYLRSLDNKSCVRV